MLIYDINNNFCKLAKKTPLMSKCQINKLIKLVHNFNLCKLVIKPIYY